MDLNTDTLIIGAGPAGLAVAGQLTRLGVPFLLLEKSDQIAHSWHEHYERLCLHTVKQHSNLPFKDIPAEWPTYVPRLDMIRYWTDYAREMGIEVQFGQEVRRVHRNGEGWVTETATGASIRSTRVVVATGYNRVPVEPVWPGQETFKGVLLHSRQYRNAEPFAGQNVLIIGMGNTGAELAIDLHEKGARPTISVRSPINFIRRDILGRPAQNSALLLGKLPDPIFDFIARRIQKWTVGDLSAYGLPPSPYAPSEQLRRFGKVPVIDIGTIDLIRQRKVRIAPDVGRFNEHSVTFKDGSTESFDAVIACTGYRAAVEDFVENAGPLLSDWGYPKALWFEEEQYRGLYFSGFSIPLNGILRNIKLDSAQIARHIGKAVQGT